MSFHGFCLELGLIVIILMRDITFFKPRRRFRVLGSMGVGDGINKRKDKGLMDP